MIPLIRPTMPGFDRIRPYYEAAEERGIWSNFGPINAHCCREIQKLTGGHPVLCSSATSAIEVLTEMYFHPLNTAFVPDFTHAGSILPVLRTGMDVNIVGCDLKTRALDLRPLYNAIEHLDFGGMVVVNPFGRGIDRRMYTEFAELVDMKIIFDYAGAWGDFKDLQDGHPTVYSFHATKSLPIGEGSVVVLPTEEDAHDFSRRINFGTMPDRTIEQIHGTNFKLSEVSAAVLAAQLEEEGLSLVWNRLARRKQVQRIYSAAMGDSMAAIDTIHMNLSLCTIILPKDVSVFDFEAKCEQRGFIARQYYIPLHTMPAFHSLSYVGNRCPELSRCVALPSDVTIEEATSIAGHVSNIISELSPSSIG